MLDSVLKLLSDKRLKQIVIVLMAVLATISIYQGIRNAISFSQDFQWDAAKAIASGLDPYEMSLSDSDSYKNTDCLKEFYSIFADRDIKQNMEANQFPSLLLLLLPYTFMPPMMARIAWVISNLIFTIGIVVLLRKTFLRKLDKYEFAYMMLIMLAGTPYRNQLGVGQHTLFSFFFFMLAVYLCTLDNKHRVGIAVCMFISYFKYTLTAPLALYFLYKRKYIEFAMSVLAHIALTFVAAKMLGKSFLYMILTPLKVSSLLSAEGGIDLGAVFGGTVVYMVIGGFIAIMLTVIAFRLPENKEYILFPLLLIWSLVLTYHRTYDYFVLAAVPVLFIGLKNDFNEKISKITWIYYQIMIIAVFFVLRVFNENTASKIAVGILYYLFAIAILIMAICVIKKEPRGRYDGSK